jgi:hypothetical protein
VNTLVVSTSVNVLPGAYIPTTLSITCASVNPAFKHATGGGVSIFPINGATDVVVSEPYLGSTGVQSLGWTATVRNEGVLGVGGTYASSMTVFAVCAPGP